MTYLSLLGPLAPYAFAAGIATLFGLTAWLFWCERRTMAACVRCGRR